MKSGKAAGPSGIAAETLKAAGEDGVLWVTDICNAIVREGKIPTDWRKSWMVCVCTKEMVMHLNVVLTEVLSC